LGLGGLGESGRGSKDGKHTRGSDKREAAVHL
jgi:hypothetical protein